MNFAERQLLKSLQITSNSLVTSTTVFTDRPLRRNLSLYRSLESKGKLTILLARDVTATNERYKKTFITYRLES